MKSFFFLLPIFFSFSVLSYEPVKPITIGVAHYPPYVDKNKNDFGLLPSYLTKIFKLAGRHTEFKIMPYSRSIKFMEEKEVDFVIVAGTNLEDLENPNVMASETFYTTENCGFYNTQKHPEKLSLVDLHELKNYTVATIIKSPLHKELSKYDVVYTEVPSLKNGVDLVLKQRVDFFFISRLIMEHYIQANNIEDDIIDCGIKLKKEKIYIATAYKRYSKLIKKINENFKKFPFTP